MRPNADDYKLQNTGGALLEMKWGTPNISKSGVTVAEDVEPPDPFENMGVRLVRQRQGPLR